MTSYKSNLRTQSSPKIMKNGAVGTLIQRVRVCKHSGFITTIEKFISDSALVSNEGRDIAAVVNMGGWTVDH